MSRSTKANDGQTLYQLWGQGELTPEFIQQFRRELNERGDTPWKPVIDKELDTLETGGMPNWDTLVTALRADAPLGTITTKSFKVFDFSTIRAQDTVTYKRITGKGDGKTYDVYIGVVSTSPEATGDSTIDISPRFLLDSMDRLPAAHNIKVRDIIRVERDGDILWSHRDYKKILELAAVE